MSPPVLPSDEPYELRLSDGFPPSLSHPCIGTRSRWSRTRSKAIAQQTLGRSPLEPTRPVGVGPGVATRKSMPCPATSSTNSRSAIVAVIRRSRDVLPGGYSLASRILPLVYACPPLPPLAYPVPADGETDEASLATQVRPLHGPLPPRARQHEPHYPPRRSAPFSGSMSSATTRSSLANITPAAGSLSPAPSSSSPTSPRKLSPSSSVPASSPWATTTPT